MGCSRSGSLLDLDRRGRLLHLLRRFGGKVPPPAKGTWKGGRMNEVPAAAVEVIEKEIERQLYVGGLQVSMRAWQRPCPSRPSRPPSP
jgi:hypothetical protein